MLMIVDVFFTVAVISIALRTVPKLQLWVTYICPTADRTPMGVGLGVLLGCCIRTGLRPGKLNRLFLWLSLGAPHPPGEGNKILNITAYKQQIISQCH